MEQKVVGVGISVPRKEAQEKVTGDAKYNADFAAPGLLHAWLVTSLYAHAWIKAIDYSKALELSGVYAVVTGENSPGLIGPVLEDRPPPAGGKVRYFGEPIAVIAASEAKAKEAAGLVNITYEPIAIVNSSAEALKPGVPLIHENLAYYTQVKPNEIFPKPGSNIAQHVKIRKGDINKGWAESVVTVEAGFLLPQSDHIAMETHNVRAQIKPDGTVIIHTANQGPFDVAKMISRYFQIDQAKITVHVPLVGGAFGGKTPVQLELIAYLASKAVKGRAVKLVLSREQDISSSPTHLGLEAKVKLGADGLGIIKAAEFTFQVDIGAYVDSGSKMTRAMAADCTGPYNVENVVCDAYSVYTNHTYVTAFRGFGRLSYAFALERTLDKLAFALGIDPFELRLKNAIKPGDTTPTMVMLNKSNIGNLGLCLERVKELINWQEGVRIEAENGKVRAKGLSCLWKTSSSPPNATSGAIITFNKDGTLNLNVGAVEFGEGSKTSLAQLLAEKLKIDVDQISVTMEVNTKFSPKHWKTVASMTNYMVGNAVLDAAEDLIKQLCRVGSVILRCPPELLVVGGGKIYLKDEPDINLEIKAVAQGYEYPDGSSIGGLIIGRGNFIMRHLNTMDWDTGKGRLGPAWTVGAQAVEVELDLSNFNYKLLKAATVLDAGKVINPKMARGVVMGAMCMGFGYGTREALHYDKGGKLVNPQLRTYHLMRFGENPEYLVDFIETPQLDSPYGVRGIAEHGIIGIPAALANALSAAAQVDLNQTPLTPVAIWNARGGLIL